MEDSRKYKRSGKKGLPTPDPHVDGENGKKAIVYNTKKGKELGGQSRSTNLLFGLCGPGSIPVLDSSQIWSIQLAPSVRNA